MIVSLSLVTLSWAVVLQQTVKAGGDTPFKAAISIAYPVADIMCGTIAVVALVRSRHGEGASAPVLVLLLAGTVSCAIADSGFAILALHGKYYSGHPIDLGWFAGWLLMGLASRVPSQRTAHLQEGSTSHVVGLIAPYLLAASGLPATH